MNGENVVILKPYPIYLIEQTIDCAFTNPLLFFGIIAIIVGILIGLVYLSKR